jgi:hypothetical protein
MVEPKSTAAIVAIYASMAASAAAAGSAVSEGIAAGRRGKHQAAVFKQQALAEQEASKAEEVEYRRQESRRRAQMRALYGGSGVQTLGTVPSVLEDAGTEAELQALRIRYGGDIRSQRLKGEAKVAEIEGKDAKGAAFARAGASLLEAGGTFAGGYDKLFPKKIGGVQKMTPSGGPFSTDRFQPRRWSGAGHHPRRYD